MKKITYLSVFLMVFIFNVNAQSDCSSALTVTDGTYTVAGVTGTAPQTNCANYDPAQAPPNAGMWYEYTNNTGGDLSVNVTTDLAVNAGLDTKVSILEGACTDLACVANNDDVDFANDLYLSNVTFLAEAGQTYLIVFDATWDASGFDFTVSSSSELPDAPLAPINPDPADNSTVFLSDGGLNEQGQQVNFYVFGFELPTGSDDATEYIFELGLDSSVSAFSTTLSNPAIELSGLQLSTEYFWRVTATNPGGSTVGPVWSFTTESTLSNNQFVVENDFVHFINNNKLNIQASTQFNEIQIFDINGKRLMNTELNGTSEAKVDITTLDAGVYIARIQTENGLHSFKFVK